MRATARPARWADTAAIAVLALGVYLLLAQEALHGLDVHVHVYLLTQGVLEHPFHLLYMKLIGAAWAVLEPTGMSPHHAIRLVSAVGSAGAAACCHRAALRLGLERCAALAVAAAGAAAPAALFFATVPEIHGLFAAFAGLAWWIWAGFGSAGVGGAAGAARSTLLGAALGAATGLAASVHATGHLLLGAAAVLAIARFGTVRRRAGGLVAAAAAHVAVAWGLAAALRPAGARAAFGQQLAFLLDSATWLESFTSLPRVVWSEWLLAFAPLSVVWVAAFGRAPLRRCAFAFAAALAAYLACAFVLLDDMDEHGAYLLPLAFPAAVLTVRAWSPTRLAFCAATSLLVGIGLVVAHDRPHPDGGYAAGLLRVAETRRPAVICLDVHEQVWITKALPDAPFVRLDSLMSTAERGDAAFAEFCQLFDLFLAQVTAQGRTPMITARAFEVMRSGGVAFFSRFVAEHLLPRYRLEEVRWGAFAAEIVRRR